MRVNNKRKERLASRTKGLDFSVFNLNAYTKVFIEYLITS